MAVMILLFGLALAAPAYGQETSRIGGAMTVEPNQTVDNAKSVGGKLTVSGTVRNDAVAIGGDVVYTLD